MPEVMSESDFDLFESECYHCCVSMMVPDSRHRTVVRCTFCGRDFVALRIGEKLEGTTEGISYYDYPKIVGYWQPAGPDPKVLVAKGFYGAELSLIIRYLQTAPCAMAYLGYSYCRFNCGIEDSKMGDSDLSDGEWVWPQGLAHYVEVHGVRLPVEFISTMRKNHWVPPDDLIRLRPHRRVYDSSFWETWTAQIDSQLPNGDTGAKD
jgi:hypothetical protein